MLGQKIIDAFGNDLQSFWQQTNTPQTLKCYNLALKRGYDNEALKLIGCIDHMEVKISNTSKLKIFINGNNKFGNLSDVGLGDFYPSSPPPEILELFTTNEIIDNKIINVITYPQNYLCFLGNDDPSVRLSSCAFKQYPGIIWLTDFSASFLPPNSISNPNYTALIENIYHESLHHLVYYLEDIHQLFNVEARENFDIYIPWRKDYWSAEHAFHAWIVYHDIVSIRKMNIKFLQNNYDNSILDGSIECEKFLHSILVNYKDRLTDITKYLLLSNEDED